MKGAKGRGKPQNTGHLHGMWDYGVSERREPFVISKKKVYCTLRGEVLAELAN